MGTPACAAWTALFLGVFHGAAAAQALPSLSSPQRAPGLPESFQTLLDRLVLYGDARVRAEGDWERFGAEDRRRGRVRLRLGANYSVGDELLVGARLTTGDPDDSRDSNATLGNDFGKERLNLDRLFLTWTSRAPSAFFITFGKFAHRLARNPIFEELVWYSDIQPEGALMGANWRDVGFLENLSVKGGTYLFREEARGNVAIGLAEVSGQATLSKDSHVDASLAWYGYSHPDEVAATTVDEYQVLNAILGYHFDGENAPWKVALEGIANVGVTTPNNTGWAAGVSYGEIRRRGDWRVYYQYQEVGNDAVFSPVANADFLLDRNFRGHVFNADYRWTEASTLRLRVLAATPLEPAFFDGFDDQTLRVRLDFSVKL